MIRADRLSNPSTLLEKMLNHPEVCSIVVDVRGNILQANEAAIDTLRYSEEELLGMSLKDLTGPPYCSMEKGAISMPDGYISLQDREFVDKDQNSFWVSITAHALDPPESGAVFFFIEKKMTNAIASKTWNRIIECIHMFNRVTAGLRELPATITNTERLIIGCWKNGLSLKETADKLNISTKTVENHRYTIRKKLKISRYSNPLQHLNKFDTRNHNNSVGEI